jgi:hypothetical protein
MTVTPHTDTTRLPHFGNQNWQSNEGDAEDGR